jgi:hypothetical protein
MSAEERAAWWSLTAEYNAGIMCLSHISRPCLCARNPGTKYTLWKCRCE